MNRKDKLAYEAPAMERFELRQTLTVLGSFSISTSEDQPSYGEYEWGDIKDQSWGNTNAGFPTPNN